MSTSLSLSCEEAVFCRALIGLAGNAREGVTAFGARLLVQHLSGTR